MSTISNNQPPPPPNKNPSTKPPNLIQSVTKTHHTKIPSTSPRPYRKHPLNHNTTATSTTSIHPLPKPPPSPHLHHRT
ncbi:hypothetical protein HanPSC8_Chr16g0703331 [Helianthus annuus]|nr:hypothetical protein HanPSC8_Chr16g0703331 [Helianthus annuus]